MNAQKSKLTVVAVLIAIAAGLSPVDAVAAKPGKKGPSARPGGKAPKAPGTPVTGNGYSEPPAWKQLDCQDLPGLRHKREEAADDFAKQKAPRAPDQRKIKKLERPIANYDKQIKYLDSVCDSGSHL